MSEFKKLLTEMIGVIDPFKKDMKYFIIKNTEEDGLRGRGDTKDMNTVVLVVAKNVITEINSTCCLSSLAYLKSILDSPYIQADDARLEIVEDFASDHRTMGVKSLAFVSKKLKVNYQASDPLMVEALQIASKRSNKLNAYGFPCEIRVNKETAKEFSDAARIFSSYDNSVEVCRISYGDKEVKAEFGERGHRTQIILASDVQGEDVEISNLFLIDDIQKMLKISSVHDGKLSLSSKYLKLDVELDCAFYTIISSSRKVRG
jgi:hypothetical protein